MPNNRICDEMQIDNAIYLEVSLQISVNVSILQQMFLYSFSLIDLIVDRFVGSTKQSGSNVGNAIAAIDGIVNYSLSRFLSISIVWLVSNASFNLSGSFGWKLVCVPKKLDDSIKESFSFIF